MGRYVANELNLLFPPSKTSFRLSQKIALSSTLPSDGPYVATTQILTFSNLNLTFRILVLTHTKSTIVLYHKSLIRIANPSIPLSFLSTLKQTHFTPHHSFSPIPFIFVSVTASKSNLPFLNTSITSILFSSTFIPLTFHVPIRFIYIYIYIYMNRMGTWNVRGINVEEKRIEVMDVFKKGKFDLLAVTETKMKGIGENEWCGVKCVCFSVERNESGIEGFAILMSDLW